MWKPARLLTGIIGALSISCAQAQQFPSRQIHVLVGFGPGGISDLVARIVSDEMGRQIGQAVVVENRPGAAGLVAANAVKAAAPDGYTLYSGSVTAISPLFMKAGVVANRDLAPVSQLATGDMFIYMAATLPVQNLKDLQAYAKTNPLRFGTPSTFINMLMVLVAKNLSIRYEPILYKTTDQITTALLSGDAQITISTTGGFESFVKANKLRVISTFSGGRIEAMPDVPTAREQGAPVELYSNLSLWATPKTPAEIISKLNSAAVNALKTPATAQKIRALSFNPAGSSPEELLRHNDADMKLLTEAAEVAGLQPE